MTALKLVITEGRDTGRGFQVSGTLSIGRDADAGIVIDDEEASRRHAVVTRDGDGVVVQDLDSTNGTWVNEELRRLRASRARGGSAAGRGDRARAADRRGHRPGLSGGTPAAACTIRA